MGEIPVARNKRVSYENFAADCPWCGNENIFNRASDLRTFKPIAGLDVLCLSADCGKPFRITGDSVSNPHEMFIFDCYELMERKHYMNCILNLAQAYEVFFNLYFRVELLYKPFGSDPDRKVPDLNRLSRELYEAVKDYSFARMRALFLNQVVAQHSPKNLGEAKAIISAFPPEPKDPKNKEINRLQDVSLVPLLRALKATTINTLRNRVVHKHAYRPTRDEVVAALDKTRSILFPLTRLLDLHDEVNWYRRTTIFNRTNTH